MRLEGKVALITGAGSGIGRETALLFASEGAAVVAVDVNAAPAHETVQMVEAAGGQASVAVADVAKSAECAAMVFPTRRWLPSYRKLAPALPDTPTSWLRAFHE